MLKERPFDFPQDKSIRVICDTDCYNECDDQYAVAHMLMTPRFDIRAVIAEQYGNAVDDLSEQHSYDELVHIAGLMGMEQEVNILHGAPRTIPDENTPAESEGARFIVEEAMKDDPRPLFVCNLGALTNLASACLMEPGIAGRLTAVWIGGDVYPKGGFEFNQNNDLNAARVVFKSQMELWQVPKNVYITMKVSFFELLNHVYPCGELGKYLVENTMRVAKRTADSFQDPDSFFGQRFAQMSRCAAATSIGGELWSLGDSPCVGLMMNSSMGRYRMADAPCDLRDDGTYDLTRPGSRKIRVYEDIDNHFIINDMFEKLKFYFGQEKR